MNNRWSEMGIAKKQLLQLIVQHDGKLSWYQLDREIYPDDVPIGQTVMSLIDELKSDGLIIEIPSTLPQRYKATSIGIGVNEGMMRQQ